jgi:hypothetical protein
MDKEKLYNILVDHIKKEWSTHIKKDIDYENRIINQPDTEIDYKKILEHDQLRHKGRIDELNDLMGFIDQLENK